MIPEIDPTAVTESPSTPLLCASEKPDQAMDYGTFMATEGGRKCPMCGKYAKRGTVGNLSFITEIGNGLAHISMYGHLPGHGCNSPHNVQAMAGKPAETQPESI